VEGAVDEIAVGALSDMADGDYRIFAVETLEVGVFRLGDRVVAYENTCPHAGGPVCQGKIFNRVEELLTPEKKSLGLRFSNRRNVVCPWHGYEFDIETGCHPGDPKVRLKPVKVDVRDGQIFIKLAS
jgi:nitrite reductase (NADH) small subunit